LLLYNLKLNICIFSTCLSSSLSGTDYIYTDVGLCCKLPKCIGQTRCSYEHYLVTFVFNTSLGIDQGHGVKCHSDLGPSLVYRTELNLN